LTNRHVRFTRTARRHVQREKEWWLANRDHIDVFGDELEQALKIVAILPGAGTPYNRSPLLGVRRIYMRKSACTSITRLTTAKSSSARYGVHVDEPVPGSVADGCPGRGQHDVARNTIKAIRTDHGPAPERGTNTPWKTFLAAHWDGLAAADFFTVEVLTLGGLVRYVVFFVMKLKSRTVEIAGSRVSRTRRGWRSSRGT
jgi:hypothetical protein